MSHSVPDSSLFRRPDELQDHCDQNESAILALHDKFDRAENRFSEIQGLVSELSFRLDRFEARFGRSLERLETCFEKLSREIENRRTLRFESGTGVTQSLDRPWLPATAAGQEGHRQVQDREGPEGHRVHVGYGLPGDSPAYHTPHDSPTPVLEPRFSQNEFF